MSFQEWALILSTAFVFVSIAVMGGLAFRNEMRRIDRKKAAEERAERARQQAVDDLVGAGGK